MRYCHKRFLYFVYVIGLALGARAALAQDLDALIDAMRDLRQVSASDKENIAEWIRGQATAVGTAAEDQENDAFVKARTAIRESYEHSRNSEAFKDAFAEQLGKVAQQWFGNQAADPMANMVLARALRDINRVETAQALLAGLKSSSVAARFLCLRTIGELQSAIAGNNSLFPEVVSALRDLGVSDAEEQPVIVAYVYEALGFPGRAGDVFDEIMEVLAARLQHRRDAVKADGAEVALYRYLLRDDAAALNALSREQKSQLVKSLAVLFRMNAQRYNDQALAPTPPEQVDTAFDERDAIERALVDLETIFMTLVGRTGQPGRIESILRDQGWEGRPQILDEMWKWVGNPDTNTQGTLNEDPWNVPVGAP